MSYLTLGELGQSKMTMNITRYKPYSNHKKNKIPSSDVDNKKRIDKHVIIFIIIFILIIIFMGVIPVISICLIILCFIIFWILLIGLVIVDNFII